MASDAEMAELNAKVATLEETLLIAFQELRLVKHQQQALQARQVFRLEDKASTPTSIYSIPVEVLIKIFLSIVHRHGARDACLQDAQDAFHSAVTISHVCRTWREACLHTSRLWTFIVLGKSLRPVETCLDRSKTQPLSIVLPSTARLPSGSKSSSVMRNHLCNTISRWSSLHWISSDSDLEVITSMLQSTTLSTYPLLTTLDLATNELTNTSRPQNNPFIPADTDWAGARFPRLGHMRLASVPLTSLPPVEIPSLRTLYLQFPYRDAPGTRSYKLALSNLCAFLYRVPNLEELIIDDSVIVLDVRLRYWDEPDTGKPPMDPWARNTHTIIPPITMRYITRFQWDFVPAKDLWKFFYFVRMPNLRELDVLLDRTDQSWLQSRGGIVATALGSNQPAFIGHPPIRFDHLEDFSVECMDAEGLSMAFRKFEFPILKNLSLTFAVAEQMSMASVKPTTDVRGPGTAQTIPSQLPRAESIFRDPRLPNLKSLELTGFHLDGPYTKASLQYMPALERLSMNKCTSADVIVQCLGGQLVFPADPRDDWSNTVIDQDETPWLCPTLKHLELRHCPGIWPDIVYMFVRERKKASTYARSDAKKRARHVVPLKKRALKKNTIFPSYTPLEFAAMGSEEHGAGESGRRDWRSHERIPPRALRTVYIERCKEFSDADIELIKETGGLEELVYVP